MAMREIPESVLAGVVALLRPYCKRLTAARLTQMLTGEAQDNLKPVRQIAEENGINLFSLHHFIKRNNIPPAGTQRGKMMFNEPALLARYYEVS